MFSLDLLILKSSRQFAIGVFVTHLCALYALSLMDLSIVLRTVFCILLIFWAYPLWKRDVLLSTQTSVRGLQWLPDSKSLKLRCLNGKVLVVSRLKAKMVLSFLVILNVTITGQRWPRVLFVFRDSCSSEGFRRLKVLANHATIEAPAG